MTIQPKTQLRKKLVLLPQHLVELKRNERQCKKARGLQCHRHDECYVSTDCGPKLKQKAHFFVGR